MRSITTPQKTTCPCFFNVLIGVLVAVMMTPLLLVGCDNDDAMPMFTLSPPEGPSGTEVTLSFTGLEPGSGITITDSSTGTTSTARADANGNAAVREVLFGEPGQVVTLTAIAGPSGREVTLTAMFTVTE